MYNEIKSRLYSEGLKLYISGDHIVYIFFIYLAVYIHSIYYLFRKKNVAIRSRYGITLFPAVILFLLFGLSEVGLGHYRKESYYMVTALALIYCLTFIFNLKTFVKDRKALLLHFMPTLAFMVFFVGDDILAYFR